MHKPAIVLLVVVTALLAILLTGCSNEPTPTPSPRQPTHLLPHLQLRPSPRLLGLRLPRTLLCPQLYRHPLPPQRPLKQLRPLPRRHLRRNLRTPPHPLPAPTYTHPDCDTHPGTYSYTNSNSGPYSLSGPCWS